VFVCIDEAFIYPGRRDSFCCSFRSKSIKPKLGSFATNPYFVRTYVSCVLCRVSERALKEEQVRMNPMNGFDMVDPCEEPGFPTLSSTPRSIRNMESLISMINADTSAAAATNKESSSALNSPRSPAGTPVGTPVAYSTSCPSPREPLGSPKRSKSMTGRDVWHLGKGTGGPRSYGSFSKVTKDKWDSARPGGETVWDHILKSEKAKETRAA